MRNIKEVMRLRYEGKLSVRQISQILKIGKSSVGDYLSRFRASGLGYPIDPGLSEEALEKKLFDEIGRPKKMTESIDFKYIDSELRKPNVTLQLLWEEYRQGNPGGYQYSWFCELYRGYQKKQNISMRQIHKYGEKAYCDFGKGVQIYDAQNREWKQTQLFAFVWGASNYTYAQATLSETVSAWVTGNVNALHFSGCAPKAIVPDQPKAVATKACHYDPEINPVFVEFSEHYQTTIFPARPGKPKDKGKAEVGVLIAKRWILARLRNRVFYSLGELNEAIEGLVKTLNEKVRKKTLKSRKELFETMEKPHAMGIPDRRYEVAEFKKVSVNIDHHIEFDDHYYSVPYTLIKHRLDVRATSTMVEIFKKDKRVACHKRSYNVNDYTTVFEHRPPSHQKFLEWTPERILAWAKQSGDQVSQLVQTIMSSRRYPEQAYRVCLGIIRLEKKFTKKRLNNACKRALNYQIHTYRGVKNILLKNLDMQDEPDGDLSAKPMICHDNIRGSNYYENAEQITSIYTTIKDKPYGWQSHP